MFLTTLSTDSVRNDGNFFIHVQLRHKLRVTLRSRRVYWLAALLLMPALSLWVDPALNLEPPPGDGFVNAGRILDSRVPEISGLVVSRRHQGILWAINDSGNRASLFAIDLKGAVQAEIQVRGASNIDWEDIAAYQEDGESFLVIADTGDNFALRSQARLYVVPEPSLEATTTAAARTLEFRWPDGPRDVEALAVDQPGQQFLFVEKQGQGHVRGLYSLPLRPDRDAAAVRVASLRRHWPPPPGGEPAPRFRGLPTAMDLTPDGRSLLLLSYLDLAVFERQPGEAWQATLDRPPASQRLPKLPLFESAAIEPMGGVVWLTPEGVGMPLYRWDAAVRGNAAP